MADLPGHKWKIASVDKNAGAYVYTCNKCGCSTLSGHPLPSPYNKVCK